VRIGFFTGESSSVQDRPSDCQACRTDPFKIRRIAIDDQTKTIVDVVWTIIHRQLIYNNDSVCEPFKKLRGRPNI
jgi:hypothetical protein